MDPIYHVAQLLRDHGPAVLVTVVETRGSTPRKAGSRMMVFRDGAIRGTIGGGAIERAVIAQAQEIASSGTPKLVCHQLTHELAMCCGGEMKLFIEPLRSDPTLVVIGCGHVGRALAHAAHAAQFSVIAVDDLDENHLAVQCAEQHIHGYDKSDIKTLPLDEDSFVVIATRDHALDQRILEWILETPCQYVGVIGSKRKARLQQERLRAKGFTDDAINRIHCPIGLPILAQTPEEIAISILAQIIYTRRASQ